MSANQVTISVEQLNTLKQAINTLSNQVQSLIISASQQQSHVRISSISYPDTLHCEYETKQVLLGKVNLGGKLKSFNYDLIAKDQYWGNRHGSIFEIVIQRNDQRIISTGDICCSRYDENPTSTDKPNDHFNEHIQSIVGDIFVYPGDEVFIIMKGLYGGHTVDITNLHIRIAVDC
jgi:hypothetical protein